ncbi:hypothetical protein E2C01_044589 [Portunus trituberculatus]|uniref:Uncharacterized protein n=1 Tax=Portunus trituberculatus TaxID=210409 RepID=A0A5B7FZR9_PORTR|nr:hypothetical protein [Portunus trituberculatus]
MVVVVERNDLPRPLSATQCIFFAIGDGESLFLYHKNHEHTLGYLSETKKGFMNKVLLSKPTKII